MSVDAHELKMAIKNRLELEDRVVFDDLCKLMEGVANFDFFDLKDRWVKRNSDISSNTRELSAAAPEHHQAQAVLQLSTACLQNWEKWRQGIFMQLSSCAPANLMLTIHERLCVACKHMPAVQLPCSSFSCNASLCSWQALMYPAIVPVCLHL